MLSANRTLYRDEPNPGRKITARLKVCIGGANVSTNGVAPSRLSGRSMLLSGHHLSLAESEEIAILRSQKHDVCMIARRLGRDASTILR